MIATAAAYVCGKMLGMHFGYFYRLWARYDYKHTGVIDFRDFLRKLGVNAATAERQLLSKGSDNDEDGKNSMLCEFS